MKFGRIGGFPNQREFDSNIDAGTEASMDGKAFIYGFA
jgi:hypothetical protein